MRLENAHSNQKIKLELLQNRGSGLKRNPSLVPNFNFFDQIKLVKGSEKSTTLTFFALKDTEVNEPKSVERRANSFHGKATNKETTIKITNE